MTIKQLYKEICKECNRFIGTNISATINYYSTGNKFFGINVMMYNIKTNKWDGDTNKTVFVHDKDDLPKLYTFVADSLEKYSNYPNND